MKPSINRRDLAKTIKTLREFERTSRADAKTSEYFSGHAQGLRWVIRMLRADMRYARGL